MALQDWFRDYCPARGLRGSDGHEYIAVLSGVGGWVGAIVSGNLDPADPTAALGFVGAVPDLKKKTTAGGMLYVFALPQH